MVVEELSVPVAASARPLHVVLAVDDETWVLSALSRLLHKDGVRVLTATSGAEALTLLENQGSSIGVIISDYAMPGMNGAELLHAVRVGWPDVTRVLLTGNADLSAAARAVNEGQLSRLFTKPWKPEELREAVAQAMEQHHLLAENRRLRALADEQAVRLAHMNQHLERLVGERTVELEQANARLQRSLLETVRLLLTSLAQRLPRRAAQCKEVARLAGRLAERAGMGADEARRVQVAALVHDVGLTALPDALLRRTPAELSLAARTQYQRHAVAGQRMLSTVEELTDMASWIRHHHERWDGRGYPDGLAGEGIPFASRIIALADGYFEASVFETGMLATWLRAQETAGAFDPELLHVLEEELRSRSIGDTVEHNESDASVDGPRGHVIPTDTDVVPVVKRDVSTITVRIANLREGMVLDDDVRTASGAVLVCAGERLSADSVKHIQQFARDGVLATTVVAVLVGTLVTDSTPPLV